VVLVVSVVVVSMAGVPMARVPMARVPMARVPMAVTVAVAMTATVTVTVDRYQHAPRVHAVTFENPDLLPLVERWHRPVRARHGHHRGLRLT
jgi:hypothetical protein